MEHGSIKPQNEAARLAFLRSLELLDTPPESSFNRIAETAAKIFGVRVATVSLVDRDRVWLKARHGVDFDEVERDCAFCARVVSHGRPVVVEDTLADDQYSDWPLVCTHGTRFFAGAPLRSPEGYDVGALCLLDTEPRSFSPEEVDRLSSMAELLMEFILLRHTKRQSEASNRAKSSFLAHMSHELRTPMTAIIGYTDTISSGTLGPEAQREACETVSRNARHLLSILDDVLDLSRIEAGRLRIVPETVRTLDLLKHAFALHGQAAAARGVDLVFELDPGVPAEVRTDETRAKQVLFNLISNAVKFTEGGRVGVRVSWREQGERGVMSVGVEDTGIGMNAEQLDRVFAPFEQGDASMARRYGGTGLGLTISRRLAETLGGSLNASSTPGEGSRFVFEFDTGPAEGAVMLRTSGVLTPELMNASHTAAPAAGPSMPICVTLIGARILVAEDSADNQRLIRHVLEKAGAEVTLCDDGRAAVDALEADPGGHDLILMDVQMPRMDGLEATRHMRESGHTLPIVALTAHAMKGDREDCRAAGCNGYLSKPFDRTELIAVCAKHRLKAGGEAA